MDIKIAEDPRLTIWFFFLFQHVEALEAKIKHLMSQLEGQSNLHHAALRRGKENDQQLDELNAKIKKLEGEVATGDVVRDRLKSDKERVSVFDIVSMIKV